MRRLIASAVLALSAVVPSYAQERPVNVSGEAIAIPQNDGRSFARPSAGYKVFGLDGFSFAELYADSEDYFGKNIVSRNLGNGFGVMSEHVYGDEHTNNRLGLGVNYSVPLPKDYSLGFKFLPLWLFDGSGRIMGGISGDAKLPYGLNISGAFFEFNLRAQTQSGARRPEAGYGEIPLCKPVSKKVDVCENTILRNKGAGKLMPKIEAAAMIRYKF